MRSNGSFPKIGIKINAIIAGGCTVEQIRHAREVELNASWCYDWGQKLGDLMQEDSAFRTAGPGSPMGRRQQRNGCSVLQPRLAWRKKRWR